MDFILSSLIIFSILSTPIDKISSNLIQSGVINIKKQKRIVKQETNPKITSEDIRNLLNEIDNNFLTIKTLKLKKAQEKKNFEKEINFFIKEKKKLTIEQINYFKSYSELIEKDELNIKKFENSLNNKKTLTLLQNDILSNSNNLHIIYEKLSKILKTQIDIIEHLYKIIFNFKCCAEIF